MLPNCHASLCSANSFIDLATDIQHLHSSLILSGAKRSGRHIDERSCSKIRHPGAVFATAPDSRRQCPNDSLSCGPSSVAFGARKHGGHQQGHRRNKSSITGCEHSNLMLAYSFTSGAGACAVLWSVRTIHDLRRYQSLS